MFDAIRDADSAEFFDGTARGELMIKRCVACAHDTRPTALACAACCGSQFTWVAARGNATLVSWIVKHARPIGRDELAPPEPIGIVELDEGPWLQARLVDFDPARAAVGMPLEVVFIPAGPEKVPAFRPRGDTGVEGDPAS